MRLIIKEYLASLKERGDLDKSVLPNLLSEIGLRVLNTPMIGTRQNGVDIAAVGRIKGEDDKRYLYLFCIKAGNVTRRDWEVSEQAVRPELNEIRDVYLRSNVATEHVKLPIKICLCCGGELEETVLVNWAGYTAQYTTENISYEEWNGDRLAELMMRSLLARELLEDEPRRNFQKAVAMVNEPDACYEYTRNFLSNLLNETQSTPKTQLLKLRQSYICLHAVSVWAIDAENLESVYKVSELGILFCWNIAKSVTPKKRPTKHDVAVMAIMDQYLKLYLAMSELYFEKTAYKHCNKLHSLSSSVRSRESLDINIALFELIGRLAIKGIWTSLFSKTFAATDEELSNSFAESTGQILDTIVSIINTNPALNAPIRDDHMIEIALVTYLAQKAGTISRFLPWLEAISGRTTLALILNSQYPTCKRDYADLLIHPVSSEQSYRDEACAGSILYPFIFLWMHRATNKENRIDFVKRLEEKIPNCTYQAWCPDDESDEIIWCGETFHGICVTGLSPAKGHDELARGLNDAMKECTALENNSAVKAGLIPLFLTACRHYRLPIPPHFWIVGDSDG